MLLLAALAPVAARADLFSPVAEGLTLRDLREYVGTGYAGESAHCVRLDFLTGPAPENRFKLPTYPQGYSVEQYQAYSGRSFGVDAQYAGSLTTNGTPVTVPGGSGVAYYDGVNKPYEFRLPGAGSRNVYIQVSKSSTWKVRAPDGTLSALQLASFTQTYTIPLNLIRRDVDMVAIDSRMVYGQPNLDGELPGDPNADLRNPSFLNWVYKGGLFVGQASGNDASGTARVQGWVPSATFYGPIMSSLNLRALGRPDGYAAPTLRLFKPGGTDPNVDVGVTTVTWANKWALDGATLIGEDTSTDVPYGEFLRFKYLESRADPSPTKLGLAMSGESSSMAGYWQYFASAAYAAGLPLAESRPRLWTLDEGEVTWTITQSANWQEYTN